MGRKIATEAAYGDPRTFTEGSNTVKALPYVGLDGKILRVVIIGMDGEQIVAERLVADIRQRYTGAAYSTWVTGNGK